MTNDNNNVENFERKLESLRGTPLSNEERTRVWQQFSVRVAGLAPTASPYQRYFSYISIQKVYAIPVALALIVLLGAGGTVLAAGNSRPGDRLFPVELAVEHTRIALATNADAKAQLKLQFAQKRVTELEDIVDEEIDEDTDGNSDGSASLDATSTSEIKLSEHGRARLQHALSITEDFLEDSHREASTTERGRGELHDLDARFSATVDRLPLDFRNHGKKGDWKKGDDSHESDQGDHDGNKGSSVPPKTGTVKSETHTDVRTQVSATGTKATVTSDANIKADIDDSSTTKEDDDSDGEGSHHGFFDFNLDTKGAVDIFRQ